MSALPPPGVKKRMDAPLVASTGGYGAIEAAEYALASEPAPAEVAAAAPTLTVVGSASDEAGEVAAL